MFMLYCYIKEVENEKYTSTIRLRMSYKDAHYGGNLIDGAHLVHIFGDVATELLIRIDGDEGLFLKYTDVEFLALYMLEILSKHMARYMRLAIPQEK